MESKEASTTQGHPFWLWFHGLPFYIRWLWGSLSLLPFALFAYSVFQGGSWLPTQEWLRWSRPIAVLTGLACAALALPAWILPSPIPPSHATITSGENHVAKRVLAACLASFALYWGGATFVRLGVPALHARFSDAEVSHSFVVETVGPTNSRYCRQSVKLKDMPFMALLCDVPEEFRKQLRPGMTLIITGKGSWMGVKPHQLRIDRGN